MVYCGRPATLKDERLDRLIDQQILGPAQEYQVRCTVAGGNRSNRQQRIMIKKSSTVNFTPSVSPVQWQLGCPRPVLFQRLQRPLKCKEPQGKRQRDTERDTQRERTSLSKPELSAPSLPTHLNSIRAAYYARLCSAQLLECQPLAQHTWPYSQCAAHTVLRHCLVCGSSFWQRLRIKLLFSRALCLLVLAKARLHGNKGRESMRGTSTGRGGKSRWMVCNGARW